MHSAANGTSRKDKVPELVRKFSERKQGHARSAGLLATIHTRAREICGDLSCTSMQFQALSCDGRLPED
jgi:hypothetical protein